MPAEAITPGLVFDIFNIKRDGSNIVDEDDDGVDVGEANPNEGFLEKAKELNTTLATLNSGEALATEKPKPVKEEKKEIPAMEKKTNIEDAVKKSVPNKLFGDIFDDEKASEVKQPETLTTPVATLNTAPLVEKPKEKVETTEASVVQQTDDTVASDNQAHQPSTPMSVAPDHVSGHCWQLKSPAPKYEKLYEEKRDLLSNHLLKGGEIPFEKFYEELHNVSVDTNVPTWDTEEIGRRISEVQKWRDRVKFIQLRVNSQYFVWKQIIGILPGFLARIEYERGKNDGIVYEHLNDFTIYFGHLEGLSDSCAIVSKNLDGAYNSLSRQVAIQQPLQEFERSSYTPRAVSPQAQRWDGLTHANKASVSAPAQPKAAGSSPAKPQDTTWGDI